MEIANHKDILGLRLRLELGLRLGLRLRLRLRLGLGLSRFGYELCDIGHGLKKRRRESYEILWDKCRDVEGEGLRVEFGVEVRVKVKVKVKVRVIVRVTVRVRVIVRVTVRFGIRVRVRVPCSKDLCGSPRASLPIFEIFCELDGSFLGH